jgi:hypothetical protein
MTYPVIVRWCYGYQSYLVLNENPRELLRHPGFQQQYSVRPWLGSTTPEEAREEWAEMLGEDLDNYLITDSDHREYCQECHCWDEIKMWPERPEE